VNNDKMGLNRMAESFGGLGGESRLVIALLIPPRHRPESLKGDPNSRRGKTQRHAKDTQARRN